MDPAIVPLLLFAFVAAMAGTWVELKSSLQPVTCGHCPHCRDELERQRVEREADERRQAELRSWYARRTGFEDEDEERRRLR